MPMITADDGAQLFYRELGEGRRSVVFVHGWWLSGVLWDDVAPHVARMGYRVIVPDLRGAGSSDKPGGDYSAFRHANDLVQLLHGTGSHDAVVVAHSTGAIYAQLLAATWPDRLRGLALVCPLPVDGLDIPFGIEELFELGAQDEAARATILTLARRQLGDDQVRRLMQAGAATDPAAYKAAFDTIRLSKYAHLLPKILVPTLVVSADDAYMPDATLRQRVTGRIHGARQVLIPDSGHYVPVERPRELAALVGAFLAGLR